VERIKRGGLKEREREREREREDCKGREMQREGYFCNFNWYGLIGSW